MPFDTSDAAVLAIVFLVPGFILSTVLATTFRRRASSTGELWLQHLTLSCVNMGIWSWLIVLIIERDWFSKSPKLAALAMFAIVFLSPLLLGAAALWFAKCRPLAHVLSAVGFKIHRLIPTAWDFKFQQEQPCWAIVRLKDGSSVFGLFGTDSFAGDEPGERDLYLQAAYRPAADGPWRLSPGTRGILISASEIATIEFLTLNPEPEATA